MLIIKPVLKIPPTDPVSVNSALDIPPFASTSSPKSPKFNELRSRHLALNATKKDLKSPKIE